MKRLVVTILFLSISLFSVAEQRKLIALTFDDGPRPYVLYGRGPARQCGGLLDVLQRNAAPATFFYMGWRLTPGTYGDHREFRTEKTTLDAARDVFHRGYEIEDHSYSHVQFRIFGKKYGESGIVADVDRASELIRQITGRRAEFVRPPDWITWSALDQKLTSRGYRVMNISPELPLPLRDVNSADYLCAGQHPKLCPKPSLQDFVLQEIEQREKRGVYTHILAFHELSTTTSMLRTLLPELRARGYRFVTLNDYVHDVNSSGILKQAAVRMRN